MRSLLAVSVVSLIGLAGCAPQSMPTTTETRIIDAWPPEMLLADARNLTPEECKAILVARAALEASNKAEIHAHFRVNKQHGDWRVTADYTPARDYVSSVGNFSTLVIAPDWSVKQIIGGA